MTISLKRALGLAALSIGFLSMNATTAKEQDPFIAKTEAGLVMGAQDAGLRVFKGIPFAAPQSLV